MARSDNMVTLIGNLTETPDLRYTTGGQAMVRAGLACNRRWQDRATNQWKEETDFFTIVAWREIAENMANSLPKGTRVIVTGRLQQRQWETPNGERRSTVEVQVDEIGPSLRWATAQVARVGRSEGTGANGPAAGDASRPFPQPPQTNFGEPQQGYDQGPSIGAPAGSAGFGPGMDDQPWDDEPAF